jgi:hypothetical protein
MQDTHPIIKKLQFKDLWQPVLIVNSPKVYDEVIVAFEGVVQSRGCERQL